ncbi:hypothetical protein F5Y01DRAFT_319409 [Xylaria sp. FL0043]|nr:hypothetical protein F5Y01DRAFT_319409 [Xylaria sp. FL0043]
MVQVIDLSMRLLQYAGQAGGLQRTIQEIEALKTEMDETKAHLRSLASTAQGTDIEQILNQFSGHCEDVSEGMKRLQMLDYSERASFALLIRDKISPLRRQLPSLALREWQELETKVSVHGLYNVTNLISPASGCKLPFGSMLIHLLTSNIPESSRERCEIDLKCGILEEIYSGATPVSPPISLPDAARERAAKQNFLHRLLYQGMTDRNDEISEAHGTTFSWILEPSVDTRGDGASFRYWLSDLDSRPIFWISGKPGSGKSTLMKFIYKSVSRVNSHSLRGGEDSTGTSPQLESQWGGDLRVYVASFFFKSTGATIQRSFVGLLRSLLLQILRQDPEIIPSVAPYRWEALLLFGQDPKPFDILELQEMLISALHRRHAPRTFLFIDGLDECENQERSEMLKFLHKIADGPGVKICISSRPLPGLKTRIGSAPIITLEYCTEKDMKDFVTSKMEGQSAISGIVKEKLVHELTVKASGCFLWLVLVVKLLEKNLADRMILEDLLNFINELPEDLEGLFQALLEDLKVSQPFVASIVLFVGFSSEPISLLRLSFMDMDSPSFALQQRISSLSQESLNHRVQSSIERIVLKSNGFLETSFPDGYYVSRRIDTNVSVNLTHETVKRFLDTETALNTPRLGDGSGYDTAALYCAASLSLLKISRIGDLTATSVSTEVVRCVYMAMFTSPENENTVIRILDEVECTCYALLDSAVSSAPWMDMGRGMVKFHSPFADQFDFAKSILLRLVDRLVTRGGKRGRLSARLQERIMSLGSNYVFNRPRETTKNVDEWPEYLSDFNEVYTSTKRAFIPEGLSIHGAAGPATTRIESNQLEDESHNISREQLKEISPMKNTPTQFKKNPQSIIVPNSRMDTFGADSTELSDGSSDKSWDSSSSANQPVGENHPLAAFTAEAIQAVFQGYVEYRRQHPDEAH